MANRGGSGRGARRLLVLIVAALLADFAVFVPLKTYLYFKAKQPVAARIMEATRSQG